jgi:hypothetical protein
MYHTLLPGKLCLNFLQIIGRFNFAEEEVRWEHVPHVRPDTESDSSDYFDDDSDITDED